MLLWGVLLIVIVIFVHQRDTCDSAGRAVHLHNRAGRDGHRVASNRQSREVLGVEVVEPDRPLHRLLAHKDD